MNAPKETVRIRQFAKFLLWSMMVGVVLEDFLFCWTTEIPVNWLIVRLICWGILLSFTDKYLRRAEDFLTRWLSRRLDSE